MAGLFPVRVVESQRLKSEPIIKFAERWLPVHARRTRLCSWGVRHPSPLTTQRMTLQSMNPAFSRTDLAASDSLGTNWNQIEEETNCVVEITLQIGKQRDCNSLEHEHSTQLIIPKQDESSPRINRALFSMVMFHTLTVEYTLWRECHKFHFPCRHLAFKSDSRFNFHKTNKMPIHQCAAVVRTQPQAVLKPPCLKNF